MHIEIDTPTLAAVAETAASFAHRAFGSAVWMHAENGLVTLCANGGDLDFYAERQATVTRPGSVGIYGNTLAPLVKSLGKGPLTLETDETEEPAADASDNRKTLHITQGRKKLRLPCLGEMFKPERLLPPESSGPDAICPGPELASALKLAIHCANKDDEGTASHCVSLQGNASGIVTAVSISPFRFAKIEKTDAPLAELFTEEANLPNQHAKHLLRWLGKEDYALSREKNRLVIRAMDSAEWLLVPLCVPKFYDHSLVFSRRAGCSGEITLSRAELSANLARACLMAGPNDLTAVAVRLDTDSVTISHEGDSGAARETILLTKPYAGPLQYLMLSAKGTRPLLDFFTSEIITFAFDNNSHPIFITGENDPGITVVTMPSTVPPPVRAEEGATS